MDFVRRALNDMVGDGGHGRELLQVASADQLHPTEPHAVHVVGLEEIADGAARPASEVG